MKIFKVKKVYVFVQCFFKMNEIFEQQWMFYGIKKYFQLFCFIF